MPERPNSQSFYWNYNFFPFSERKSYMAVKKCIKFVCPSVQANQMKCQRSKKHKAPKRRAYV